MQTVRGLSIFLRCSESDKVLWITSSIEEIGVRMDFDKYQFEAMQTCLPSANCLDYLIPGIAAEAGEVAGKYAKYVRDCGRITDLHIDLKKELGDVLWFCAMICEHIGVNFADVAQQNLDKLASRAARNVLKGQGDDR
jgi:NTP pyrophosphatase (non-canonical NTP hydrolase)